MINRRPTSANLLWLSLGMVCFASMAFYTIRVWSANQPPHFSDLYARWWGAHELLLHGRNPYSPQVSHEIQKVIYGTPITPSADDPLGIGGGFAYPPYTAFLFWPTLHGSFATAEKTFFVLSIVLSLASIALWTHAASISMNPWAWITLVLFVFGSFPVLQGLKLQNLSLIAAALIAIALALLCTDHFIWAGVLLASSTFKPQFVVLIVPWLILWSLAERKRRWQFALSFLATMILLILGSELLLPSGFRDFLDVARAYQQYTYGHSILDVWLTPRFGPIASAILVIVALKATWRLLALPASAAEFVELVAFLLAMTVVIIPTLAPHAQVLLLPGLILLGNSRDLVWTSGSSGRLLLVATGAMLAWPWIAALGLVAASLWWPIKSLLRFWEVPLYTSAILPLAICIGMAYLLRHRVVSAATHYKKDMSQG